MHPAALEPDRLLHDCQVERTRASGPGGQHRNKVETAVRLTHTPTGITAMAGERRSQERNRTVAVFRLRVNLALALREAWPWAAAVKPGEIPGASALWRSRCRKGRLAINPAHEDFPAILAEALDALAYKKNDPAAAATALGCTTSQLIKLLKAEPRALEQVNRAREGRGQHRLK